jgi:hypothetical protein
LYPLVNANASILFRALQNLVGLVAASRNAYSSAKADSQRDGWWPA